MGGGDLGHGPAVGALADHGHHIGGGDLGVLVGLAALDGVEGVGLVPSPWLEVAGLGTALHVAAVAYQVIRAPDLGGDQAVSPAALAVVPDDRVPAGVARALPDPTSADLVEGR